MVMNGVDITSERSQITADLVASIMRVAESHAGAVDEVRRWLYPALISVARRLRARPEQVNSIAAEAFSTCIERIQDGTIRELPDLIRHARTCVAHRASDGSPSTFALMMAEEEERIQVLGNVLRGMHPHELEELRRFYLDEHGT
jgi:hypothetical protein